MAISPARTAAFDILLLVENGSYASDLLREKTAGFDARDAGLASELVFGVLRFRAQLDFLIRRFSGREAARLDNEVRLALELGIYQLRYLDRVPRHAAVGESVELVKRARKRSAAGLLNAVLRKVNREPVEWADRSTALSHPEWLLRSWERQYGAGTAAGIARSFLQAPEHYIRVPADRWEDAASLAIQPTAVPGCYRFLGGDAEKFRRQDISSQAIVPLLELEAGQWFLDLCAAPGNKTAQALDAGVRTVACDVSLPRLRQLRTLEADLVNLDATGRLPFRRRFDRILVDAPCSGTGTIGRNPEIKWRVQPSDLLEHQKRQRRMLAAALDLLAPGGRLVYSTCSLEREENEEVVEAVLGSQAGKNRLERFYRRLPGRDPGDGFFAAIVTGGARSGGGTAMLTSE